MNVNLKNRKVARLIREKQVLSVFHCGFDTKKNVRHRKNCKHSANRRHAQLLIKRVFIIGIYMLLDNVETILTFSSSSGTSKDTTWWNISRGLILEDSCRGSSVGLHSAETVSLEAKEKSGSNMDSLTVGCFSLFFASA